MRNFLRLTLALTLLSTSFGPALAQTRPRRVGQQPTTTSAPRTTTHAPAPAPVRRAPQMERPEPTTYRTPERSKSEEVAEEVGEDEVVRVNASLVTVPVSVLDRDGRFISGLRKEDFRVFEDGSEQQLAYFAPVEQPFTVALVIDTSGSTQFRLEDIQDAAIAFLDQLRPADRVAVISFDDEVRVLSEPTSDRGRLRDAVRRTRTGRGTRLFDAVDHVIREQLSRIQGRKAMVLFTDGVDTSSRRASAASTLEEAEELDAMIYPIQYDTTANAAGSGGQLPGRNRNPRRSRRQKNPGWGDILGDIILGGGVTIGNGGGGRGGGGGASTSSADYATAGEYLRRLAAQTGGRHHEAQDLDYIEEAFNNIAEELRRQYSLGYYPSRQAQAEERRQIKVRVRRPNLVVRARDSYVYRPDGSAAPQRTTAQENTNTRQTAPVLRPRNLDSDRGGFK